MLDSILVPVLRWGCFSPHDDRTAISKPSRFRCRTEERNVEEFWTLQWLPSSAGHLKVCNCSVFLMIALSAMKDDADHILANWSPKQEALSKEKQNWKNDYHFWNHFKFQVIHMTHPSCSPRSMRTVDSYTVWHTVSLTHWEAQSVGVMQKFSSLQRRFFNWRLLNETPTDTREIQECGTASFSR